jgi:hypothetical protein
MVSQGRENPEDREREITTDEFLGRLEAERANSGSLIKLVGRFLGNSDREDFYRLYLSEDLNRYLEFSKEGTVDAERFPSGRIVVWLRAGTKVVKTAVQDLPEDFLKGSIQQQSLARQAAGVVGSTGQMMMLMANSPGCCGGTNQYTCTSDTVFGSPTCSDTNPCNPPPYN